ncbi:hypothetical protein [Oenococcus oeni]|uniref:hypothetical protein n=3 Tax=Oenococcus oeni TaxID=1247 RepID=UPI000277B859|nr:hypothetical protein [Oenococcus oeni]EJO02652.1 hypothetical protein AWRIB418_550 [Oenococcus oeni AWRIB418]QGR01727.1 hypothetical protein E4R25_07800 [Oenococcus oeni]TEU23246.1 hypothetical protein E2147_05485 [Oenococcus oeni]TEU52924.1 hypothetical protein E2145_08720 [Oenococcus oeni]TEU62152.1 hypothetical protein E2143_05585 [Oenococcus oeni]
MLKNIIALSPLISAVISLISVVISLIALKITWLGINRQIKNSDRADRYQRNTFILQNKINENNNIITLSASFMELVNQHSLTLFDIIRKTNEQINLESKERKFNLNIDNNKEKEKFSNLAQKRSDEILNLYKTSTDNSIKIFGIVKQLEIKQFFINHWSEIEQIINQINDELEKLFDKINDEKRYMIAPKLLKNNLTEENKKIEKLVNNYVSICLKTQSEIKIEEKELLKNKPFNQN